MELSNEYIRRARADRVDILAAAENEDQYHHAFVKYSLLIVSSNTINA